MSQAAVCPTCNTNHLTKTNTSKDETKDSGKDEKDSVNRCAGCHSVYYCNRECQKKHWRAHKTICQALQELSKSKKGFIKNVLKPGDKDKVPKAGQEVYVHYTGVLPNGKEFDSSRKGPNSAPFSFLLGFGQVIQGWDEGVRSMVKGEKAQLIISAEYAYGEAGHPPSIPPKCPLIFEVELLDFKDAEVTKSGTNFL